MFFRSDTKKVDAQEVYKQSMARRLAELVDKNKRNKAKEKALKEEFSALLEPDETVGRITRKVIQRWSPTPELKQYLKEKGLWRAVTVRTVKILKDKVAVHAEEDEELRELFKESFVDQNRIETGPPEERI